MLPAVPEAAEALTSFELTHAALQQYVANTHREWFNSVDAGAGRALANSLLTQDRADRACLGPAGWLPARAGEAGARASGCYPGTEPLLLPALRLCRRRRHRITRQPAVHEL